MSAEKCNDFDGIANRVNLNDDRVAARANANDNAAAAGDNMDGDGLAWNVYANGDEVAAGVSANGDGKAAGSNMNGGEVVGGRDTNVNGDELAARINVEMQQEKLLLNRLPMTGNIQVNPQRYFLQRKLQYQRKFFDSGEYAMSKVKAKNQADCQGIAMNKSASAQLLRNQESVMDIMDLPNYENETMEIPRPDTIPQRKLSSVQITVHRKISPDSKISRAKSFIGDGCRSEPEES